MLPFVAEKVQTTYKQTSLQPANTGETSISTTAVFPFDCVYLIDKMCNNINL